MLLIVSHLIHLTPKDRRNIEKGRLVTRQGICIPSEIHRGEMVHNRIHEIIVNYRIGLAYVYNLEVVTASKSGFDLYLPLLNEHSIGKRSHSLNPSENLFVDGGGYGQFRFTEYLADQKQIIEVQHHVAFVPMGKNNANKSNYR